MEKQDLQDIAKIMGVEEEMIPLLPQLPSRTNLMNPWVRQLPGLFQGLRLKRGMTVLDIPCGRGGVSVPLARKYSVKVLGYDIFPDYVQIANDFAVKHGVGKLCSFNLGDIRQIVKRKNICDLLLWVAAPRLWGKSEATIKALRGCVNHGGLVLIADAYLYSESRSKGYEDYETLADTTEGFTSCGDRLVRVIDHGGTLWEEDFRRVKRSARQLLDRLDDPGERRIMKRFLKLMEKYEKKDPRYLGLAIWLIQVSEK